MNLEGRHLTKAEHKQGKTKKEKKDIFFFLG